MNSLEEISSVSSSDSEQTYDLNNILSTLQNVIEFLSDFDDWNDDVDVLTLLYDQLQKEND